MGRLLDTIVRNRSYLFLALCAPGLLLFVVSQGSSETRVARPRQNQKALRRYAITNLSLSAQKLRYRGKHPEEFRAVALNNRGQVVGNLRYPSSERLVLRAALWDREGMRDLGGPKSRFMEARDINDKAEVVGMSREPSQERALFWKDGQTHILPSLKGFYSRANRINNTGIILGSLGGYVKHKKYVLKIFPVVQWKNTKGPHKLLSDLDLAQGGGINDHGQIVGAHHYGKVRHAFLWRNGRKQYLTLGQDQEGHFAVDINQRTQVIGNSGKETHYRDPWPRRAWLWDKGRKVSLGTLGGKGTDAHSINNHGQVVGTSNTQGVDPFFYAHAFLWEKGKMHDLNHLIPAKSGWELYEATDINDKGQIIGHGFLNQKPAAFLLTPLQLT